MKQTLKKGLCLTISVLSLLSCSGCNTTYNNQTISKPKQNTEFRLFNQHAHIEYSQYPDGSQQIKEYPDSTEKFVSFVRMYQDSDGDGLVDIIMQNREEVNYTRLLSLLVRKKDYDFNKKLFDEADKKMQGLKAIYPK